MNSVDLVPSNAPQFLCKPLASGAVLRRHGWEDLRASPPGAMMGAGPRLPLAPSSMQTRVLCSALAGAERGRVPRCIVCPAALARGEIKVSLTAAWNKE